MLPLVPTHCWLSEITVAGCRNLALDAKSGIFTRGDVRLHRFRLKGQGTVSMVITCESVTPANWMEPLSTKVKTLFTSSKISEL